MKELMWAVFGPEGKIFGVWQSELGAWASAARLYFGWQEWRVNSMESLQKVMQGIDYECRQVEVKEVDDAN